MDSLEQKIGRLLCESGEPCDGLETPEYCDGIEKCWGKTIPAILALLQPQQPAEGELVPDSIIENLLRSLPTCMNYRKDMAVHWEIVKASFKAQRAHMIAQGWLSPEQAQGWVKLPSEEEAFEIVRKLERSKSGWLGKSQELLKLLQEGK